VVDMKFRIKKEDGLYFAEYKEIFYWYYVSGSISRDIEKTRKACRRFKDERFEKKKIVENFEL
jgi:hypothetical protein